MSKEDDARKQPRLYSLGQPRRRTGLGGYSMKTTVTAGTGFMLFLFTQMLGAREFAWTVILPITVVATALVSINLSGRSIGQVLWMIIQDRWAQSKGYNTYVSGPSSPVTGGTYRLPGVLSRTELVTGTDAVGKEFAAILNRGRREATVLLDVQLSGQTPITQEEKNLQTAEWGRWLAGLSLSGDVNHIAFVVSSRPGTGDLVRQEVEGNVRDDAPWIARQIQMEAADVLSDGTPELQGHIAVTFQISMEDADDFTFLELIGTRLPSLYESLSWAGMNSSPMTEPEVCARIHAFYNPAAEPELEKLSVQGIDHGLDWDNVGPAWAEKKRRTYFHESAVSTTWEMVKAPQSTFEDRLLQWLVAPHPRIPRKRVCLVYRPYSAASGAQRVESEHRDALVAANSSKKVQSAAAQMRVEHTEAARRAQAQGAQLGRYSLWVTATAPMNQDTKQLNHDVEQLGSQSNLQLKVAQWQQDTCFAISCGAGWVPWHKDSEVVLSTK